MTNPWPAVGRSGPQGAKGPTQRLVSPSEGNEARRKGPRGSHIFIVPLKQGNLTRRDPGEGRGMSVMDPWGGNPSGALYLVHGSP